MTHDDSDGQGPVERPSHSAASDAAVGWYRPDIEMKNRAPPSAEMKNEASPDTKVKVEASLASNTQ